MIDLLYVLGEYASLSHAGKILRNFGENSKRCIHTIADFPLLTGLILHPSSIDLVKYLPENFWLIYSVFPANPLINWTCSFTYLNSAFQQMRTTLFEVVKMIWN